MVEAKCRNSSFLGLKRREIRIDTKKTTKRSFNEPTTRNLPTGKGLLSSSACSCLDSLMLAFMSVPFAEVLKYPLTFSSFSPSSSLLSKPCRPRKLFRYS
jgi:hypothetical protein